MTHFSDAFLHTSYGFGKSKVAAGFDKAIGVTKAARNWSTVLKLAELGRAAESWQPHLPT